MSDREKLEEPRCYKHGTDNGGEEVWCLLPAGHPLAHQPEYAQRTCYTCYLPCFGLNYKIIGYELEEGGLVKSVYAHLACPDTPEAEALRKGKESQEPEDDSKKRRLVLARKVDAPAQRDGRADEQPV